MATETKTGVNPDMVYPAYKRNMVGYGRNPPNAKWPGNARVAVSFVLNYEEGGENNVLHGDEGSEWLLSDISGERTRKGKRNLNMETLYEYGSRVGFWRVHDVLTKYQTPITVYAVGMALERNPEALAAMKAAEWEIASHGYRWIDYLETTEEVEREHIAKTVEVHERLLGEKPQGLYQGKPSIHSRRLGKEAGFKYDNDSYADELPYWDNVDGEPYLVLPYTLESNDMRFNCAPGWSTASQFCEYLTATFDRLYEEGADTPKMMTIGLHCRIVGRPGRIEALERFLQYIQQHERVWIAPRKDIAEHWRQYHHPDKKDESKEEAPVRSGKLTAPYWKRALVTGAIYFVAGAISYGFIMFKNRKTTQSSTSSSS